MAQHINICPLHSICTTEPSGISSASVANPVGIDAIVSSGSNWCIKYSDGWKVMGGYKSVSSISSYGQANVDFSSTIDNVNVSFNSAPVYVHCTPVYTGTTSGNFALYGVESVSATGFTYRKCSSGTNLSGFYWTAKGI